MVAFAIKNTFVHVEDDDEGQEQPPCKTAPGDVLHGSFHLRIEQDAHASDSDEAVGAWGKRFPRLMRRLAPRAAHPMEAHCCKDDAIESSSEGSSDDSLSSHSGQSHAAAATTALASIGAEGHRTGQCIPCLMQVRWMAGKCREPCRFGCDCGRCHEPHTEEELQKIQAKMRREKKRHGAAAAALLSAAYAQGKAAPVGAGASRMASSRQ
mmetsp:Transcript_64235/g.139593  ORF Transcript_64235/g.139593 Transcript_64235/m.139593 type:complete len:210 (+) Transcript_64235:132-761(+)|eukprot:CAMPEP_0206443414 /NCGR_PEP_ID=MMETSP0324_2-20121206/14350_1 /ASSEMBLY_ACC=CAM_ASM_000836 /TAXON_ID=2866 /ORGANISM="Crypthecodinium cohnii, Strain Seligo" /LENGTH=209 /DNA_ID=CAMNT_0053911337 /DNA_START=121 /DNA_END=750 /DNA_ORIENTATION=-